LTKDESGVGRVANGGFQIGEHRFCLEENWVNEHQGVSNPRVTSRHFGCYQGAKRMARYYHFAVHGYKWTD